MKYLTPAQAVQLVKSGDTIVVQGSTSIPMVLLRALTARAAELRDVKIISGFGVHPEDAPYAKRELIDSFRALNIFVPNNLRRAMKEGVADTIPCFLGEVPSLFRSGLVPVDVAFLNVSEPDEEGYCSFGISADIAFSGAECAKTIIAQVNKYMPRTFGDPVIHVSQITALCRGDEPLVEVPTPVPSEVDTKIGNFIANEIPDGATLQIGVGGIPNAVINALSNHQHLGLHTEAITDGVLPLIEKGIIDNSQKKILPGKSVGSLILGSKHLYDYIDGNRDFVIRDVAWTNDPQIIRQNPRAMAINSAIEVDLTGQICADSIGETIISGVGGQHDFMYGAALSEGGKCFIALPSMTNKGQSKIVAHLAPGAGVVTTRFQAQYIVTEHGIAFLRNLPLADRAKALIRIADPSVREDLERAAVDRFGIGFLRLR
ncbi:MAG: acetyl-CoA hydrolase/transferase C-terminal domain-containing protein [Paludibacteraceae bacterium]|nr:acetyl-CoA hydrolase/transferase C-terminal domain-containing protein [Paludibacteraceae bacterium]